jgi:hypothetical protein
VKSRMNRIAVKAFPTRLCLPAVINTTTITFGGHWRRSFPQAIQCLNYNENLAMCLTS